MALEGRLSTLKHLEIAAKASVDRFEKDAWAILQRVAQVACGGKTEALDAVGAALQLGKVQGTLDELNRSLDILARTAETRRQLQEQTDERIDPAD